jgi:hypothetical protein
MAGLNAIAPFNPDVDLRVTADLGRQSWHNPLRLGNVCSTRPARQTT